MTQSLNVIIVEKTGVLKMLAIKEFKEEDLFKKCGFKKSEDFNKQTEWNIKCESKKYLVSVYAKVDGRANSENKYDFPPPIDTKLFFGNCVILAKVKNDEGKQLYTNLSLDLWEKIYEKLFGGFEDLSSTAIEDENEIDELENIPKDKKTKQGYLKDGFVIDSDGDGDGDDDYESEDNNNEADNTEEVDTNDELDGENIENIGSELSEDIYDYSSDEVKK
jgi:hypothetical protein